MDVGQIRPRNQHGSAYFPYSPVVLLFLASIHTRNAPDHELGCAYVRSHGGHCGGVLLRQREAFVYWPSHIDKERSLEETSE